MPKHLSWKIKKYSPKENKRHQQQWPDSVVCVMEYSGRKPEQQHQHHQRYCSERNRSSAWNKWPELCCDAGDPLLEEMESPVSLPHTDSAPNVCVLSWQCTWDSVSVSVHLCHHHYHHCTHLLIRQLNQNDWTHCSLCLPSLCLSIYFSLMAFFSLLQQHRRDCFSC